MIGLSISSSLPTGTVSTIFFHPMFRFLSALHLFVLVLNKVLSSPHRWEKEKQIQRRLAEGTNIIIDRFSPFLCVVKENITSSQHS